MRTLYRGLPRIPRHLSVRWPAGYDHPGSHFPADQIVAGLREVGVPVEVAEVPQPGGAVVAFEVAGTGGSGLVAFDHDDGPELAEHVVSEALVYFKQQFASDGYDHPNVVPAGYTPANEIIYRYLPILRAIRSLRLFRFDVYCRFGLRYGGAEFRRKAHELLSARTDFRYEGSLFRYPGGPDKVPYRAHLFEIPRAKVCVDMPGNGDLCTRLVDYLAIGACVVKPPPRARLPVRLVDGVHVVYCAPDLSDLGEVCAELVRDDDRREAIARNARDFFDRYLHKRQLGQHFVDEITDAQAGLGRIVRVRERHLAARGHTSAEKGRPATRRKPSTCALTRALVIALAVLVTLVALPEALGDRPYDPKPSHGLRLVEHRL